jgi:hypothetical protein
VVDHIRSAAWAIEERERRHLQQQGQQDAVPLLTSERIHCTTRLCNELAAELESHKVSFETPGIAEFNRAIDRVRVAAKLNVPFQRFEYFASMISPREQPTKIWNIVFKSVFLPADSRENAAEICMIADDFKIADVLFDGTTHKGRSDSRPCHRLVGPAAECGELADLPSTRTIDNAIRLAPGLPGRAGDTLQDQASGGAAWRGSLSKRDLHFFKELFPLRLRKTNDQPGEARQ